MNEINKNFRRKTKTRQVFLGQNEKKLFASRSERFLFSLLSVRTPFDKVLDKLSKCSEKSPDLIEVMQKNLEELRTDRKFENFFQSAGHTAAFIAREKIDDNEFFGQLRQSILADWSNPKWKSAKQIESLFQPLKQQFVYAMMRFKCD